MREYKIFDVNCPKTWFESVPVGNGRMGATLMCGVSEEVIHLNEETIWSSQPKEHGKANPEMPEKLAKIRQLFLDEKPAEADKLSKTLLSDCFTRIRSYESAGKLKISFHENDQCRHYRHELDLMRGVATVEYDKQGTHYKRECFISYPDDVIVYRVTSDKDVISASIGFEREHIISSTVEGDTLSVVARTVFGEHKFCVKAKVVTDGNIISSKDEIFVSDTNSLVVFVNISTEFRNKQDFENVVNFPDDASYEELYSRHTEDFLSVMSRADIKIPETPEMEEVSMRARQLTLERNKPNDGGLIMLQWQFGRYILASSSRAGSLPANLQGIWTEDNIAPWSGDYHTNINIQCNYWSAEVANLSDCHMPLFDYMNNYLLESGKETAKIGYNARGCVVHHLSDIYGFTSPADGLWGIWPHGASWLSYHMWEHYLYTLDLEFLKNTAYEFIRQAAIFFLDTMVEDKQGRLVYGPSTSPENSYYVADENGEKYACFLTISSTMDVSIIGGLLRIYTKASELLGISDDDTKHAEIALAKLPPLRVGKHGQIMEWIEDYEEVEVGHRHLSPTFALFPGHDVTRKTPDLLKAMSVTLDRRISNIGKAGYSALDVGWTLGWLICEYARLRRGESAYSMVMSFMLKYNSPNLFDVIPLFNEGVVFQIDGNMGFVAGVAEMLIQSHEGVVSLIPAIPKTWAEGSFRGLRARGGFTLDIKWENMEVYDMVAVANNTNPVVIELPEGQKHFEFKDDSGNTYMAKDNRLLLHINGQIHLTVEK